MDSMAAAYNDIRSGKIWGNLCVVLAAVSAGAIAFLPAWDPVARLAGPAVALAFVFLRALGVLKGIGMGDLKYILYLAVMLPFFGTLVALLAACALSFVWFVPACLLGKASRTSRFPFVPFLAAGAVISLIGGRIFEWS
jgi:leader peptidase (prepilin peptidase) / N-methyltransferase